MATLTMEEYLSLDERIQWARRAGLSQERIDFLLACPKYTRAGRDGRDPIIKAENPNHHLQKLGDCWWFRLRRRKTDILQNLGGDLEHARRRRDVMLKAYDQGLPIPTE
jgi:hypothetical protein